MSKIFVKLLVLLVFLFQFQAFAASKYTFLPYGRIKTTTLYSDHLLNSFSYINLSAPTSAGTDVGFPFPNQNEWSFQVAQSRFGSDITYEDVFANLEFDFIDFSVSSPTTEAKPRLRRAFVGFKLDSKNQIQMGQDWDTFSPFIPTILDYVGLYFGAGNVGFMRQQLKWKSTQGKVISELSLGLPGKNPGPAVNETELKSTPALAYRLSYGDLGLSFYYSRLNKGGLGQLDVNGGNVFLKTFLTPSLQLTSELYAGQNMNDAGLLSISHIVSGKSLKEYGGYLTMTYLNKILGDFNINYGLAKLTNPEDAGDYNYDTATKKITEDAITFNQIVRLYWNKKIKEGLSFVLELSHFDTERKFGVNDFRTQKGFSTEAGLILVF